MIYFTLFSLSCMKLIESLDYRYNDEPPVPKLFVSIFFLILIQIVKESIVIDCTMQGFRRWSTID
jgi:hypothetical protein